MRIFKKDFWCSERVPFTDMRISSMRFLAVSYTHLWGNEFLDTVYYINFRIDWDSCFLIIFACGLFKHILLLPFDLLRGSSEQIAYFSKRVGIDNYECLGKKYYCEWKFYSSQGTLQVLVPVFLTEEKIREMEKPQVDQKVKLNYYKVPIMCIYPFLQKYFASGIMIGSVKG